VLCMVGSRTAAGNGRAAMTDGWVRLSVASADEVRAWSHGEVTRPETAQPRSRRPVPRGLFCEQIFGIEDYWECHCGWLRGREQAGAKCARCGRAVAPLRRQRFGHIELPRPVLHPWFLVPLARLLGLKRTEMERVVYLMDFVVVRPGDTPLAHGQR